MLYKENFNKATWEDIRDELKEMRREMDGYSVRIRRLRRTVMLRLAKGEFDARQRDYQRRSRSEGHAAVDNEIEQGTESFKDTQRQN